MRLFVHGDLWRIINDARCVVSSVGSSASHLALFTCSPEKGERALNPWEGLERKGTIRSWYITHHKGSLPRAWATWCAMRLASRSFPALAMADPLLEEESWYANPCPVRPRSLRGFTVFDFDECRRATPPLWRRGDGRTDHVLLQHLLSRGVSSSAWHAPCL